MKGGAGVKRGESAMTSRMAGVMVLELLFKVRPSQASSIV